MDVKGRKKESVCVLEGRLWEGMGSSGMKFGFYLFSVSVLHCYSCTNVIVAYKCSCLLLLWTV